MHVFLWLSYWIMFYCGGFLLFVHFELVIYYRSSVQTVVCFSLVQSYSVCVCVCVCVCVAFFFRVPNFFRAWFSTSDFFWLSVIIFHYSLNLLSVTSDISFLSTPFRFVFFFFVTTVVPGIDLGMLFLIFKGRLVLSSMMLLRLALWHTAPI